MNNKFYGFPLLFALITFVVFGVIASTWFIDRQNNHYNLLAKEKIVSFSTSAEKNRFWYWNSENERCVNRPDGALCPSEVFHKTSFSYMDNLLFELNSSFWKPSYLLIGVPVEKNQDLGITHLIYNVDIASEMDVLLKKDISTICMIAFILFLLLSLHYIFFSKVMDKIIYMDKLTGLLTRKKALDSMARLSDSGVSSGWIVFGLQQARQITAAYGHEMTDKVIAGVADRLAMLPGGRKRLFRLDGASFAYLLIDKNDSIDASEIPRKAKTILEPNYQVDGHEISVRVAIGVGISEKSAYSSNVLRNAEAALETAKIRKTLDPVFFDENMALSATNKMEMITAIRQALVQQQFRVYFQPLVDSYTHKPLGAEALIRWKPNSVKTIPPDQFVPILEETGLIIQVGAYILRESCKQAQKWRQEIDPSLAVSVNISAKQFADPSLHENVVSALSSSGLPPEKLILEITETSVVDNPEAAAQVLMKLRSTGVKIAVDDFGVGYSSLSVFSKMPFDILKIDKSFVQDDNSSGKDVAAAIASLALGLGLQCVAEGVETSEQASYCRDLGCSKLQGYLFSKPIDHLKIRDWFIQELKLEDRSPEQSPPLE